MHRTIAKARGYPLPDFSGTNFVTDFMISVYAPILAQPQIGSIRVQLIPFHNPPQNGERSRVLPIGFGNSMVDIDGFTFQLLGNLGAISKS